MDKFTDLNLDTEQDFSNDQIRIMSDYVGDLGNELKNIVNVNDDVQVVNNEKGSKWMISIYITIIFLLLVNIGTDTLITTHITNSNILNLLLKTVSFFFLSFLILYFNL